MTTPPPDPFNPFTGGLTPSQTELVVGKLDDGTEIAEIMRQFYPLLLERAWEREGQNVEIGLAFDLRNPRVQETISGLATKVKRVADTTRDEVRRVLSRVDAEGLSYQQAARLLRGVEETAPDGTVIKPFDSAYRSFMIAVTEAAYAYSRGQVLAWQESGEVDRMQWVAETNACPRCRALDGEIVKLGDPFTNGLEVPAHPNCRCTLSPVLTDEFPLPAAPASGPQSRPPALRPSFTIKPDGTLDYVPSQQAEQLYQLLSDPSSEYNTTIRTISGKIADEQRLLKQRQKALETASQRLKRLRKGSPERLSLEGQVRLQNEAIRRIQSSIRSLDQQFIEAVQRGNPFGQVTGDKPSRTIYNFDATMTADQQLLVQQRLDRTMTILDSFMPTVSATGNPVNLGYQSRQALTVNVKPGLARENARTEFDWDPKLQQYSVSPRDDRTAINLSENSSTYVIMHEMLHNITGNNPRITDLVGAWRATRLAPGKPGTQFELLNTLNNTTVFDATESAQPDEFASYYIGRDYPHPAGYEVMPVFADYLLRTPAQRAQFFVREDPEWVKFCIDVLADPESYQ